jgi:hypothetical protein
MSAENQVRIVLFGVMSGIWAGVRVGWNVTLKVGSGELKNGTIIRDRRWTIAEFG